MSVTVIDQSERDHLVNLLSESRDKVLISTDQLSVEQWTFRQNKESLSIGYLSLIHI